ncbi:unnamed protein product [Caenorhabditis angaria]|uniref:G-protein coupled receptors family 1 profile domain-containing protein n=1 Tax=Caenorhabditis angaria TaxID=860376 RepID=A0A9P1IUE7_9PELO|nr:unnamed protein product [Caenorhabditis angaria]
MNFAITDIFACITTLFVMARLVPIGAATVQISYGFCQFISPTFCYRGCGLMFHFFVYSQYSLCLSFSYRYYILKNPAPKARSLFIFMAIAYIPAAMHMFCFLFNEADTQTVYDLYYGLYPNDTISLSQVTGNLNTQTFTGIFPVCNMLLCPLPIIVSVLLIRRKIIKLLSKTMEHLRKETKALHKQLLTALTLQACLPIFFGVGTVMFGLEASGLVRNPGVESVISASECFIPVLSPILYLYYVSPYRRSLLRIAGMKPAVSVSEATITNHQSFVAKKTNDKPITVVA